RRGRMSLFADLTSSVNAVRPGRTTMPSFDYSIVIATTGLVLFGLPTVYSAAIALADGPRAERYGRYYVGIRPGAFVALGLLALGVALSRPMRVWQKAALPLFLLCMLLLVVVLVPGIGREVNGARRWLPLGVLNFQPSELMKVAMLLFAAEYTVRK